MDCFGTYFTHVQTCNVTSVQSATEWTASVHTLHMSKTGGLSSHRCWPQNTVRVVNHTEKSKKTKKSMIPMSGSKWWFCHSEIKDYMFSWDGKSPAGCLSTFSIELVATQIILKSCKEMWQREWEFFYSFCSIIFHILCNDGENKNMITCNIYNMHIFIFTEHPTAQHSTPK